MPLIEWLAKCGLVFIPGSPPATEEGSLLVWTGGCNAVIAYRNGNGLWINTAKGEAIVPADEIICWMRLPHPSIWPELDIPPGELFAERDLYAAGADVLGRWLSIVGLRR
jgi:hypothetical protein